jgi:undecaprenyl diphosphate synthase
MESVSNTKWPPLSRIPRHVAIIMDGNGRWAQARGLPRLAGHRAGTENLRRILQACTDFGIEVLTVYAFSTENWARPEEEVRGLMTLLTQYVRHELDNLDRHGVQIRHSGKVEGISPDILLEIQRAVERTRQQQDYPERGVQLRRARRNRGRHSPHDCGWGQAGRGYRRAV